MKRFLKGFERAISTVISHVPQSDLVNVLNGLCEPPFEPLESVHQKFLSFRTNFLLAITSAKIVVGFFFYRSLYLMSARSSAVKILALVYVESPYV